MGTVLVLVVFVGELGVGRVPSMVMVAVAMSLLLVVLLVVRVVVFFVNIVVARCHCCMRACWLYLWRWW